uniref:Uncharacterized protein n=1 Tax=Phenylobacterium glaciei TaxID=2803784 RepID=A0A974P2C6_9CAUL|nr:hypothetical protein JKL49_20855 [Phenylobacterium glaciei]
MIVTPPLAYLMLRNATLPEEPPFLARVKAFHHGLLERATDGRAWRGSALGWP